MVERALAHRGYYVYKIAARQVPVKNVLAGQKKLYASVDEKKATVVARFVYDT